MTEEKIRSLSNEDLIGYLVNTAFAYIRHFDNRDLKNLNSLEAEALRRMEE